MVNRNLKIIGLVVLAGIAILLYVFINGRNANAPSEQNTSTPPAANEQISNEGQGDTAVQPNLDTQEFKLTGSNVSCSTTTVNGDTSRSCSGNIRVVPRGQTDIDPAVYKLNEQTKLLRGNAEQDLNSLQQLSQNQTTVMLKLADGSEDMLAEIRY